MQNKIERLAVFSPKQINEWTFRVSISNSENIIIMCYENAHPENFIMRYFIDEELANAFVIEAQMGKHQP